MRVVSAVFDTWMLEWCYRQYTEAPLSTSNQLILQSVIQHMLGCSTHRLFQQCFLYAIFVRCQSELLSSEKLLCLKVTVSAELTQVVDQLQRYPVFQTCKLVDVSWCYTRTFSTLKHVSPNVRAYLVQTLYEMRSLEKVRKVGPTHSHAGPRQFPLFI